jgi:hypothetical protein
MFPETFAQFNKTLGQLSSWLDAAEAFAKTKAFDPAVYLTLRLAPDQFAFARQVQISCDTAKLAASRVTGREAPKHPDTEQSLDELRARIRAVRGYLSELAARDLEGAATRIVSNPRWEGKVMIGSEYLLEHAIPNFFFHVAHSYAILRHAGVPLGKADYLGPLSLRAP